VAEDPELDLDEELAELDTRLERLRALYEQYFIGIEKLEPSIPRKDVERRIWTLRRVKFRNTAKRFKFNVITQRFNTFQQYWSRICREIENGTYRRHLLKAEKALGQPLTIAAQRRKGDFARKEVVEEPPDEPTPPPVDNIDQMLGIRTAQAPVKPARAQNPAAAEARPARFVRERLDLDIDDLIGGGAAPISKRSQAPVGPGRPAGVAPPPASGPVSRPGASRLPPPPSVGPMAGARPRLPKDVALPPQSSAPGVARPPASSAPADRRGPPPIPSRVKPPIPARAPGQAGGGARPPAPPAVGPGSTRQPAQARPAAPPPQPAPPATPNRPPAVTPAPVARPPAAAAPPATISDTRLRELHGRLVDAKRQTKEGTSVSVDGLGRQLRAAEDKLRKQHGNRKIDFDIVIKDGKAVVKPIVR
jgi:hypothetical protein